MSNIEKIAKLAANNAYKVMQKQGFDMFDYLKGFSNLGGIQKQIEKLNLPSDKTFMSTVGIAAAPMFQAVAGAAGIPGLAAVLDMFRGGGNLGMLTRGKNNSGFLSSLRSSTAADPQAKFDPQGLSAGMQPPQTNLSPQSAPGVTPSPPPPKPQTSVGATPVNSASPLPKPEPMPASNGNATTGATPGN